MRRSAGAVASVPFSALQLMKRNGGGNILPDIDASDRGSSSTWLSRARPSRCSAPNRIMMSSRMRSIAPRALQCPGLARASTTRSSTLWGRQQPSSTSAGAGLRCSRSGRCGLVDLLEAQDVTQVMVGTTPTPVGDGSQAGERAGRGSSRDRGALRKVHGGRRRHAARVPLTRCIAARHGRWHPGGCTDLRRGGVQHGGVGS